MVEFSQLKQHLEKVFKPEILNYNKEYVQDLFGHCPPLLPELVADSQVGNAPLHNQNLYINSTVPSQEVLQDSLYMPDIDADQAIGSGVSRQKSINRQ